MSTELINLSEEQPVKTGFLKIPASLYHSIDALSYSRLKIFARSPRHYLRSLEKPKPPTEAMERGTMIHLAVYEPQAFARAYVVVPEALTEGITTKDGKPASSPKATTEYKERLARFAKEHYGKEFISREDWDMATAIAARLRGHSDAGVFIGDRGQTELTGIWRDEETGVLCKMRIDKDCPELETINDLKSTTDATPDAFERTIHNFKYHWQAWFYLNGMRALGQPRTDFTITAVETEDPYEPYVYNLRAEIIELAGKEIRPLMRFYAECKRSNRWPGYPTGIVDIGLPSWSIKQIERNLM